MTQTVITASAIGLRSPQFRCEADKWRNKAALQSKNAPPLASFGGFT